MKEKLKKRGHFVIKTVPNQYSNKSGARRESGKDDLRIIPERGSQTCDYKDLWPERPVHSKPKI